MIERTLRDQCGFGVLHYDRHFDALATVLDFESRWVAPADSMP
jgi:hypothetical protein